MNTKGQQDNGLFEDKDVWTGNYRGASTNFSLNFYQIPSHSSCRAQLPVEYVDLLLRSASC